MKISKLKLALILLFAIVGLLNTKAQSFSVSPKKYYTEIAYEKINNIPIVIVNIRGNDYKFLFDTGALTLISQELSNVLNNKEIKKIKWIDGVGASDSASMVNIHSLKIGSAIFSNVNAVVGKQNILFNCLGIDGIIGSNLLSKSMVQISSRDNQIILTNEGNKLDLNKKRIIASDLKFFDDQFTPYITFTFINDSLGHSDAAFDTGYNGFISTTDTVIKFFNGKGVFDTVAITPKLNSAFSYSGFAPNNKSFEKLLKIKGFYIKDCNFTNVLVSTNGPYTFLNTIGNELMNYGNVIIDYMNKKFYFIPYSQQPIGVNSVMEPISLSYFNKKLVVGTIRDKKFENVLSLGDEVIGFDDRRFENVDPCSVVRGELNEQFKSAKSIVVKESNGNVKKVSLEK